jgi:hypothetical protein
LIPIVETLGARHAHHRTGAIVHELGDRAGADRADIGGLVAHRVEHPLVAVEDLLVAAAPDCHLAAGRPRGAAVDRRIEHVEVLVGKGGVDLARHRHRIGRHVEEGGVGAHALDQTIWPERHLFDIGRHRQRGDDDLALLAESGTEATFPGGGRSSSAIKSVIENKPRRRGVAELFPEDDSYGSLSC